VTGDPCPFCNPGSERVFLTEELIVGLWDAFPASPGHVLLVTRRHTPDWHSATADEQAALFSAIERATTEIERALRPDGYNIGLNIGAAAGQTVPHLHVHVIPRYSGDVADPRGGVRHVLPQAANYLALSLEDVGFSSTGPPHGRALISGGTEDPLFPHLIALLDQATSVDIAVAFVMQSGLRLLVPHLRDVLDRDGRVRVLTGDYLDFNDPDALRLLCDLTGDIHLKIFETGGTSFHVKSYLAYHGPHVGTAFVGSSNLSRTALEGGVEWNYRVVTARDRSGFADVVAGFNKVFEHPKARPLTPEWIAAYEKRRVPAPAADELPPAEPALPVPVPHDVQREALAALDRSRTNGAGAGLVVLATGLGKTWLSAFDSNRPEFGRVLFVAHRDEILGQARDNFRRIRPSALLGSYNGTDKAPDADVLFASIQTLSKQAHLQRFERNRFDYIVVDEFHHAAARTYRALIEYFRPKFLLGLTATPERTDGGDLLALCGENLVYRCDLIDGIRRGLLCPFDYFGVPDMVDFRNIPWRSGRFDEEELTKALATRARAQNALEQYEERSGDRTIGFCVSQRHADFMADYFRAAGLRAVAVHSGTTSAPRTHSLERLEQGDLDVLFAVDMFNEGVDLPQLDTVMMLRPTESQILWLQQFGRGLRKHNGKRLKVIDYIGNHRSFLVKPRTLFGLDEGDTAISRALQMLEAGTLELPPGCSVTYDLEATNILRALLRASPPGERLQAYYNDFRERHGYRPTAMEAYHDGFDPKTARPAHPSWLSFVRAEDDLTPTQVEVHQTIGAFLDVLEVTPMTKSFKMVVLLGLLAEGKMPGAISIETLSERIREIARRYSVVRSELGTALDNPVELRRLLEENPIDAWVGARGTSGTQYFEYANGRFATKFTLPPAQHETARELVREIVDWRMAVYVRRVGGMTGADRIMCRVARASGTPMLFLPPRERMAGIPINWVDIIANGQPAQANFVQIAVNVVQRPDHDENILPELLRGWFGPEAGQPGTTQAVEFVRTGEVYTLAPVGLRDDERLQLWRTYPRATVPPLFGFAFKGREGQSGVVERERLTVLFVTLDKTEQPEEHRYDDGFVSPSEFRWQSQNRTTRESAVGQRLANHITRDISIHLFVRTQGKIKGETQPFTYCGPLAFERWDGDKPITVWWKLQEAVPERMWAALRVPRLA